MGRFFGSTFTSMLDIVARTHGGSPVFHIRPSVEPVKSRLT